VWPLCNWGVGGGGESADYGLRGRVERTGFSDEVKTEEKFKLHNFVREL
jgi:hypothetical protein